MGIGKINNYKFYEGYEDEPEVELSTNDERMETLHIWDGFFDDIFRDPPLNGRGWKGFTRDYHQCEGAFDDEGETIITDIKEYIDDLKTYENRTFDYNESRDVYNLICFWLKQAQKNNCKEVKVKLL